MSGPTVVPSDGRTSTRGFDKGGGAIVATTAVILAVASVLLRLDDDGTAWAVAVSAGVTVLVGWSYVGSGLAAWSQEPTSNLGPAMVAIGLLWFLPCLAESGESAVFTLGVAAENLYLVGFGYLILSFPDGRLTRPGDRVLVGIAAFLCTVVQLAWMPFADSDAIICDGCPDNALQLTRADGVADAILQSQRGLGVLFSLLTTMLLVRRWQRASPALRRAAAPVLWAGAAMYLGLAVSILNDMTGEQWTTVAESVRGSAFAALPVAVVAVMIQRGLARGAIAQLVIELGADGRRVDLQDALARALHDPGLRIAYFFPTEQRYVDRDGAPVRLPQPGGGRRTTIVQRDGEPVAVLVHDAALRDDALLDSVSAAAGLSLENERLRAELLARLSELQASRARLVEAGDAERTRLERNLHDGAQQRLVWLAMTLALAETRLRDDPDGAASVLREARDELTSTLEELRTLTQGLRPAVLVERGLGAALDELRRRSPLPVALTATLPPDLPPHVETAAYFVVSEALTNAAKHSRASSIEVHTTVSDGALCLTIEDDGVGGAVPEGGSGIRGLRDRVEALGGRIRLTSEAGHGTRVEVQLSCD
ncbi:MAG TPA: sensor histidine kinase [Nocardioides sp.]|nr:sensor histidine kinase [Nocardioides sp.]